MHSGPAPHGGIPGRAPQMTACAPPNENCAPPSEDCAPKKWTGSGLLECKTRPKLVFASGIFVIFVDWHWISWHFWDKDLSFFFSEIICFRPENPSEYQWRPFFCFVLEITCIRPEKLFEFLILAGKSLWISVKTFFFWDHLFLAGKTVWIFNFGRKISLNFSEDLFFFFWRSVVFGRKNGLSFLNSVLWIFGLHLVQLIQTGINFSCSSRIHHLNKLLMPPQIYFCPPPPPSHAILVPGLVAFILLHCM